MREKNSCRDLIPNPRKCIHGRADCESKVECFSGHVAARFSSLGTGLRQVQFRISSAHARGIISAVNNDSGSKQED